MELENLKGVKRVPMDLIKHLYETILDSYDTFEEIYSRWDMKNLPKKEKDDKNIL